MSQLSSGFLNQPGMGTVVETFERAFTWGAFGLLRYFPVMVSSGAVDSGNTPTTNLRPGLVMGVITANGQWTNYSPTATDGSQVARGVLPLGLTMYDPLTGANQVKVGPMIVAGGLKAAGLTGLDGQARADLSLHFQFDDDLLGNTRFPVQKFLTKTSDYTVTAADNLTSFDNFGAVGAVIFTLPTLANGLCYNFRGRAAQNLTVTSAAGNDIEAMGDLTATSVSFQTGGEIVGGEMQIYSNPAATKWLLRNLSAGANTVTVA